MDGVNLIRTIGYGGRSLWELLHELGRFETEYLVDVRSSPYSRFTPEFSREALAAELEPRGIRYVFMGDALGGRPEEASCYAPDGKIDYARCRMRPAFQQGVEVLDAGVEGGSRIVLMCSESKPQECHRTKLVAEELVRIGVPVAHIDERGVERTHDEIMGMITAGQATLFGGHVAATTSRKQYRVA
jgi:uncharacterized protein (DUF488 family)